MKEHKLLKKLSISIASLALICPLAMSGLNNTNVNARRRHVRTHRVYRHHRRSRRNRRRNHKSHESLARWYKRNSTRLFKRNFYSNKMFRAGVNYASSGYSSNYGHIAETTDNGNPNLRRGYVNNHNFKKGWIIGDALNKGGGISERIKPALKYAKVSDYRRALNDWTNGNNYLRMSGKNLIVDDPSENGWTATTFDN